MCIFTTTTLQRQPDQCVPRDRSQDRAGLVVWEFFVFHHPSVLMFVHMTFLFLSIVWKRWRKQQATENGEKRASSKPLDTGDRFAVSSIRTEPVRRIHGVRTESATEYTECVR